MFAESLSRSGRRLHKVQLRVLLLAASGILITALLAGMASVLPFYRAAHQNIANITQISVEARAQALHNQLSRYQDMARQFTSRTEIRRRLASYAEGKTDLPTLQNYTLPRLQDAMSQAPDALGLVRFGPDNEEIVRLGKVPERITLSKSHNPGYPCQLHYLADGTLLVQSCAPILNDAGQKIGIDVVFFDASLLLSLFSHNSWLSDATIHLQDTQSLHQIIQQDGLFTMRPATTLPTPDTDADDLLARLGGDEFILVLNPVHEADNAARVAAHIVQALAEPFHIHNTNTRIGVSIGIALCPHHGSTIDSLINAADSAMYQAKQGGRNTWRFAPSHIS